MSSIMVANTQCMPASSQQSSLGAQRSPSEGSQRSPSVGARQSPLDSSRRSSSAGSQQSPSIGRVRFLRSLEVAITDVDCGACLQGKTLYTIRVSVSGSSTRAYNVEHGYSSFLRLRECLRPLWTDSHIYMPPMPPKSTFRRALLPSFRAERQRLLSEFLSAAIVWDPTIANRDLRSFLGVAAPSSLERELTKSGVVGCPEEDNDTLSNLKAGDDGNEGHFRDIGKTAQTGCSSSDIDDDYMMYMPGSYEIFQRLGEIQAMNAALEKENEMIASEMTSR